MAPAESTPDLIKRVTAAALKALAGRDELTVQFGHGGASLGEDTVHLPAPAPQVNRAAMTKLRGISDALALRLRYHDRTCIENTFPPAPKPAPSSKPSNRYDAKAWVPGVSPGLPTTWAPS